MGVIDQKINKNAICLHRSEILKYLFNLDFHSFAITTVFGIHVASTITSAKVINTDECSVFIY